MLDNRDRLILDCLFKDARLTLSQLSRIVHITRPAIFKRVKWLEAQGYLSRYDSIINWQMLPFTKIIYFFTTNDNKDIKKLLERKECFTIIRHTGKYTHSAWCFFQNDAQQKSFEKLLPVKKEKVIIKSALTQGLSLFSLPVSIPRPKVLSKKYRLDTTDIKIMSSLSEGGARKTLNEISQETGISIDVIHYRKKELISHGYFSYFLAQPDTDKLKLLVTYIFIKTRKDVRLDFLDRVLVHFKTSTGIGCAIVTKDQDDYLATLSRILEKVNHELSGLTILHNKDYILLNRYPFEFLLQ